MATTQTKVQNMSVISEKVPQALSNTAPPTPEATTDVNQHWSCSPSLPAFGGRDGDQSDIIWEAVWEPLVEGRVATTFTNDTL